MVAAANLVEVAALVGDTARATMLNALMGGQSLTATELAYCANVSRSTVSLWLEILELIGERHLALVAAQDAIEKHLETLQTNATKNRSEQDGTCAQLRSGTQGTRPAEGRQEESRESRRQGRQERTGKA